MGRKVDVDKLVGASEIADRLGLAYPQSVHSWRRRYEEFPQPVARLRSGRQRQTLIWNWRDVERWARKTGRLPAK
jgi:hypothetical protein